MATQGQRRAEGRAAIRRLRVEYRKTDSSGERLERELDRLIKRKTMIGADQLGTLAERVNEYIRLAESLSRLYAIVWDFIKRLPQ